jgi:hypothetical protein
MLKFPSLHPFLDLKAKQAAAMRITFNPNIMNTSPIRPIQRVMRKTASITSEAVDQEAEAAAPVTTSVSELGRIRSKEQEIGEKKYQKKNALWNTMLNL